MSVLGVLANIPSYYLFRRVGWPRRLPMSLTVSVTYRCNSRCRTCNIHQRTSKELGLEEWKKVFQSMERGLFWATFSGGEPFLRDDLADLVKALYDSCRPSMINIPTNSLLSDRILSVVESISGHCEKSQVVINLSVDEVGARNDEIRGVRGSYAKCMETFLALRKMKLPNVSIGFHTVLSKFNVKRIPEIYRALRTLRPDSYITEIAEEREELKTVGSGISPSIRDYAKAVEFLNREMRKDSLNKVGQMTRALRAEYYGLVKRTLKEKRQVIPCYAGFSSGQISPDGEVWFCCIKAEPVGRLKDVDFDFKKLWFSDSARLYRARVKQGRCYCPLANAAYTNMLQNPRSLLRVAWNFLKVN